MNITWRIFDDSNDPITGGAASTELKLRRVVDGFFFDFNDSTFKNSAWTNISTTLTEVSSANCAGLYEKTVTSTNFNNGLYQVYCRYTGSPKRAGSYETTLKGGAEVDSYVINTLVTDVESSAILAKEATVAATLAASADNAGISTLTSRLTSQRAANLDNLDKAVSLTLQASAYTTPPTVGQIDTQLSNVHGSGVWGSGSTGAYQVTLQYYITSTTTPITDVNVLVLNSDQSATLNSCSTDALGQCTFSIDSGTYKVRASKGSVNFTVPQTLSVSADLQTHTFYGTAFSPTVSAAGLQTVYGWITDLSSTAVSGVSVTATLIEQQFIDDTVLSSQVLTATTDTNGYFELQIAQGAYVMIKASTYLSMSCEITSDATKALSDYA